VLAAARAADASGASPDDPWSAFAGYAHFHRLARQVVLFHGDEEIAASVAVRADGRVDVVLPEGEPLTLDPAQPVRASLWPGHVTIFEGAQSHNFAIPDPFARSEEAAGKADTLRAPMPGLVKIVRAAAGDAVTRGQPLLVLEAMKMEHSIAATHDGVLAEIVAEGTQVTDGMVLVRFESAEEAMPKSG
jgi:3-methylcrotonyl-CoA carboxylase alpha subunit